MEKLIKAITDQLNIIYSSISTTPAKHYVELIKTSKNGQWEILEKAYVNDAGVPKGSCDCGAHKVNSSMHSDWCGGLKGVKGTGPHADTHNFLKGLSSHPIYKDTHHELNEDAVSTHPDAYPDDVAISSDHGDSHDSNHPGFKDYDAFQNHIDDHDSKINQHMGNRGYQLVDEADGSGNGLHYGSALYRKPFDTSKIDGSYKSLKDVYDKHGLNGVDGLISSHGSNGTPHMYGNSNLHPALHDDLNSIIGRSDKNYGTLDLKTHGDPRRSTQYDDIHKDADPNVQKKINDAYDAYVGSDDPFQDKTEVELDEIVKKRGIDHFKKVHKIK